MAKQSGIHQLRGKVGEMSYYRQAGVDPGLVRRINQSMSGRVKTSDEFVNTRLNNSEFKKANQYATVSFHSVFPSLRVMFRRFAIAKMTARFLEYIKAGTGNWGSRVPSSDFGTIIEDVLENYAKLGQYQGQYGDIVKSTDEVVIGATSYAGPMITLSADRGLTPTLAAEGINGIRVYATSLICGDGGVLLGGRSQTSVTTQAYPTNPDEEAVSIGETFSIENAADAGMYPEQFTAMLNQANCGLVLVYALVPLKKVNNVWHELQEKATFVVHGTPLAEI